MPIYEYYCPQNNTIYSFFARGMIAPATVPKCPDNPEFIMRKVLSGFAVIGRAKEPSAAGEGVDDLDDPRMEAAMAELEREMAGMDEENPDPRRMGQLMRRMCQITGEKMPEAMQEMIGRLEAGEDPEKLEEEFGDLSDLDGFGGEADGAGDALESAEQSGGTAAARSLLRRLRGPCRDPELYELSDYI